MAKSIIGEKEFTELRLKQAELTVARQMLDEHKILKETDLYLKPGHLGSILDGTPVLQEGLFQHLGLERLEAKGLIRILEPSSLRGIRLSIVKLSELKELYEELYESIPTTGNLPRIIYSPNTGRGKINGVPFKFNRGSDNRRVFECLVKNKQKRVTRSDIWTAAGRRGRHTSNDGVIELTSIITNLRAGLKGISPDHLRQSRAIELHADVTLTD